MAPIAVVAVRRSWTPRARTCGLSCSTRGPFGCRMPGPTLTGPGPLPGQRVLGSVSEPYAARSKQRVSVVNAPAAQLPGLTAALPWERPSPDQGARADVLGLDPWMSSTRPKANGTARHRCDPSSPNSGRRLGRSSHRPRRSAVAPVASRRNPAPTRPCSQQRPADSLEEEAGRSGGGSHGR